ncbi:MAG: enhanced serine sensitivity protein SseB C-terminal domain-containing protein [Candidatus Adiutrix sp.]|jgi:hypothetical protein|nr:enhanced serine sensitivity protein SseB C-terminal domain-containing protein [Candidatus Adiutrix sp.]
MSAIHPLEQAYQKAAKDPEARADFYQMLVKSTVFVVGRQEPPEKEGQAPHVHLKQWQQPDGQTALPFFASAESLKKVLPGDEPTLTMPVVDLFRLTRGTTVVFTTPEGAKSFLPDEVEAILAATLTLDPLALALLRAARENSEDAKKAFYAALINSQVFVRGRPRDDSQRKPGPETRSLKENDQFILASMPHPHIEGQKILPFFSSLEHLRTFVRADDTYLSFPALAFLSMAAGMDVPLVLNPGFEPHKFFTREEIEFILGTARPEPFEPRHFKPGGQVSLGPPEVYPQELVGALLDFLPAHRQVKAAYLTAMREETAEARPILVIGFEGEGELTEMFRGAAELVEQYGADGQPVDFATVRPGEEGLSRYFLEKVRPFYLRPTQRNRNGEKIEKDESGPEGVGRESCGQAGFFGRLKRIFGGGSEKQ